VSTGDEDQVPVEYDEAGLSTGVEAETTTAEPLILEPFDPAKIDVVTRTMTVDLLLARLRRNVLDLAPDFQRFAGIWSDADQSKLIESLLLRIPLPTLYAAEVGDESWAVVDGIQRLTTIARFVDPDTIGARPLRLRGLEYLPYNGSLYNDLPGALQTRINETELIVHLIRAGTPEAVKFNIFARINTGGRPLTRQELRHALIPGRARTLLKELANSEAFLNATQHSVRPTRMADREMVLRFLSFRIIDPSDYPRSGDFDDFLREAMQMINGLQEHEVARLANNFVRAMDAAAEIFGGNAFRKIYRTHYARLPVNKALFETESVALAKMSERHLERLRERSGKVMEGLVELIEQPLFLQAISVATGDPRKVEYRFAHMENLLREVAT
jgi:hypothetical protein